MKFGVIIPFRPKIQSKDWESESYLLSMSVISVLRQTYSSFHVYIIYTDMPSIIIHDSRVTYIYFEPGYKTIDEIEKRDQLMDLFKDEVWLVRNWDKGRRLSYGAMIAIKEPCDYIMAMDADDRLSRYFFQQLIDCAAQRMVPGWYMKCGYLYKQNSSFIMKYYHSFNTVNVSSHILRRDLVRIPEFSSTDWQDYNLFTDHGWINDRIKQEYGVELIAFSKPALIYYVQGSNISPIELELKLGFWKVIKRIVRSIYLSKKLRNEYFLID